MNEKVNRSAAKNEYPIYRAIDAALRYGLHKVPTWSWTEQIALWWGYKFRPAPRIVKLRSGASIHVDPTDYLQLMIYYFGNFEPHCLKFLRLCTGKGGTIVDVGANIGSFTIEGSLVVGPTGRVISIEPVPSHFRTLQANIQLNGMTNVRPIKTAVGNSVGETTLRLPKGGNLGSFTMGYIQSNEAHTVPLETLDELLTSQNVKSVDLIKMDIEGAECQALLGASKTLERHRPVLIIELNEYALSLNGSSTRDVKRLLDEAGYRGWLIRRNQIESITERTTHICDECIFIHRANDQLIHRLRMPQPRRLQMGSDGE